MSAHGMARWRVVTDSGTIETSAASKYRAKRNAKYRLVMGRKPYLARPTPGDLAEMRDIGILRCERIG